MNQITTAERIRLVPRMKGQGYGSEDIEARRQWVAEQTGCTLEHVASCTIPYPEMRGNIENPIGSVQMPLGIAGPLVVRGEHARGTFYVPLATTEGALVRSYERGMVLLSRAGGAEVVVQRSENQISPVFFFESVFEAGHFTREISQYFDELANRAQATTRHGKLLRIEPQLQGRQVMVSFCYDTGDAHGMNMIVKATEHACNFLIEKGMATRYLVFSGLSLEKKAGGRLFAGGKGKTVTAGAMIPQKLLHSRLRVTPRAFSELWQSTVAGHLRGGSIGYNGHYANGLTALFIATGQDVANVVNSATGITNFEVTSEGDLYASVTLPSLTLATVGGGVNLGTSRECLAMMDCFGSGKALKLAEITAATVLAGELSFGAAIASGEFVAAHEQYGRNRPDAQ